MCSSPTATRLDRAMRLVPRTLFGRHVLLIVTLVAIGQLAAAWIWRAQIQRPRLERAAGYVAGHASLLAAALEGVPPERREQTIAELVAVGADTVRIAREPPPDAGAPRFAPVEQFVALLDARIAGGRPAAWEPGPPRRVWLSLRAGTSELWYGYAVEGLLGDLSGLALRWSLAAAALAVIGAILIQRRLNAPLRALTDAARRIAEGRGAPVLDARAPEEIAVVARSFDRMATHLRRLEEERVLMLAGVSHDLRTPLTRLRLGLAMLDHPGDADLVAGMERSIETADRIIGQFIQYARLGEDEAVAATDLGALVRHAVSATLEARAAAIRCGVQTPVCLRPVGAERLVVNLLQNAARHGRPPIVVSVQEAAGRARLSVRDAGAGIPAEDVERLKQPFARREPARGGAPGAGLGLAIVERIARLHGSELVLRQLPEAGFEAAVEFEFAIGPPPPRN